MCALPLPLMLSKRGSGDFTVPALILGAHSPESAGSYTTISLNFQAKAAEINWRRVIVQNVSWLTVI